MYKLLPKPFEGYQNVIRLSDGATIPFASDNTDYQEYLKWVALGNQPLPAENT